MPSDYSEWDKQQIARGASVLQSGGWARFQQSLGRPVHFLSDEDWSCLLIERQTKLGKYLFAPYGPTLSSPESLGTSLKQIRQYAHSRAIDWLRLEPILPAGGTEAVTSGLRQAGARPAAHITNPDLTLVVDLTPPPDDILAAISQSTRSFIRKNQREHLLTFSTSVTPADTRLFTKMLYSVSRRNQVDFYTDDYFLKQAECLMPAGMMFLETALADGQPIAGAVIHDYGSMSFYTYAASLPEARRTNASALLLWQSMINARARGRQHFDLYGIAPETAPASHPWAGFSAFKRKFGGQAVEHAGTWDVPLTGKYRFYRQAQAGRRLWRRR